jgi:hypothetical protein
MEEKKQDYIGNYTQNFADEKPKRYLWPAIASFIIPGLGQWIKGETLKGVIFFLSYLVCFFIATLTGFGLIFAGIVNIFNIYDAYTDQPIKRKF